MTNGFYCNAYICSTDYGDQLLWCLHLTSAFLYINLPFPCPQSDAAACNDLNSCSAKGFNPIEDAQ